MGPETGSQFSSDDVANCFRDLGFSQFLTVSHLLFAMRRYFFKVRRFFRGQDV